MLVTNNALINPPGVVQRVHTCVWWTDTCGDQSLKCCPTLTLTFTCPAALVPGRHSVSFAVIGHEEIPSAGLLWYVVSYDIMTCNMYVCVELRDNSLVSSSNICDGVA